MKMAKKASLELPVNFLVWLILGLLMFFVGLVFLYTMASEIKGMNGFF